MAIKKGATVRQVVRVIEGVVEKTVFNEDHDCLQYLVGYTDEHGEAASRWFLESEVAEVAQEGEAEGEAQAAAQDTSKVEG